MNELERGITEVVFFQYLLIHTLIFRHFLICTEFGAYARIRGILAHGTKLI